ncbi:hypothetical protein [Actinophytocola sp.]|uniref:hypothetical protein n=1 Tax=Actinophytocola sp. TaxID=1872138 RepID=UPI002ED68628
MTIEEMDAHIAYLDAFHRKMREDMIAEATAQLETEKNPYVRESLIKHIEEVRALGNKTYD